MNSFESTPVWHRLRSTRLSGATVFAALLALYYAAVLLGSGHNTVLLLLSFWGLGLILLPRYRAGVTRTEVFLLLSVTMMFAVALLSYVANGLWSHPDANLSRYARFLLFVPIYFVARAFATEDGFWRAILFGTLVTGIWAVLEHAGVVLHPEDRFDGVSGAVNSIQFGDLMLAMLVMVTAGLPVYRRYGMPCLAIALLAIMLGLFGCLASTTRGAWIALPMLGLVILGVWLHSGFIRLRVLAVSAATGLVVLALLLPQTSFFSQVEDAVTQVNDYSEGRSGASIGPRFEMWRASWGLFKDEPLVGVGPGLYHKRVTEYGIAQGGFDMKALGYSHPHSEYFFVLATLGILGIGALCFLLLLPLSRFIRAIFSGDEQRRWLGLAGALLVIGYAHFGLTEALFFQHATFLGFYVLTVSVLASLITREPANSAKGDLL